jgi:hypothetical protein
MSSEVIVRPRADRAWMLMAIITAKELAESDRRMGADAQNLTGVW